MAAVLDKLAQGHAACRLPQTCALFLPCKIEISLLMKRYPADSSRHCIPDASRNVCFRFPLKFGLLARSFITRDHDGSFMAPLDSKGWSRDPCADPDNLKR